MHIRTIFLSGILVAVSALSPCTAHALSLQEAGKRMLKNSVKTIGYSTLTAISTPIALAAYFEASLIPVQSRWIFVGGLSGLFQSGPENWTVDNYYALKSVVKLIESSQLLLYGTGIGAGFVALYSTYKMFQSVGKLITFQA
jgi:hypothetical protein